jgi:hypothetical protein
MPTKKTAAKPKHPKTKKEKTTKEHQKSKD